MPLSPSLPSHLVMQKTWALPNSPHLPLMAIPIISRLSCRDYVRILMTLLILAAEGILRGVLFVLPVSLLDWIRCRVSKYPRGRLQQ